MNKKILMKTALLSIYALSYSCGHKLHNESQDDHATDSSSFALNEQNITVAFPTTPKVNPHTTPVITPNSYQRNRVELCQFSKYGRLGNPYYSMLSPYWSPGKHYSTIRCVGSLTDEKWTYSFNEDPQGTRYYELEQCLNAIEGYVNEVFGPEACDQMKSKAQQICQQEARTSDCNLFSPPNVSADDCNFKAAGNVYSKDAKWGERPIYVWLNYSC